MQKLVGVRTKSRGFTKLRPYETFGIFYRSSIIRQDRRRTLRKKYFNVVDLFSNALFFSYIQLKLTVN